MPRDHNRHRHRFSQVNGFANIGRRTTKTYSQAQQAYSRAWDDSLFGVKPDHVKYFWPCDEYKTARFIGQQFYEYVEGLHIPANSMLSTLTAPFCDQYHSEVDTGARYLAGENERFSCFAGADWIILVGSKGRNSSCIEFSLGLSEAVGAGPTNAGAIFMKLQPYYFGINFNATFQQQPWGYVWTKQRNTSTVTRVPGTDYMIAFVKVGNLIQHWVNGIKQNETDLTLLLSAAGRTYGETCVSAYESILNMVPLKRLRVGHSGTGLMDQALRSSNADYDYPHMCDGDTAAYVEIPASFEDDGKPVVNESTQYNGISINSWPSGAADFPDVAAFMNWHSARWFAGDKRVDYTA